MAQYNNFAFFIATIYTYIKQIYKLQLIPMTSMSRLDKFI